VKKNQGGKPPIRRRPSTRSELKNYFFFFAAFFLAFFLAATDVHLRSRVGGSWSEVISLRSEPVNIFFIAFLPSLDALASSVRSFFSDAEFREFVLRQQCIDCTLLDRITRQGKKNYACSLSVLRADHRLASSQNVLERIFFR